MNIISYWKPIEVAYTHGHRANARKFYWTPGQPIPTRPTHEFRGNVTDGCVHALVSHGQLSKREAIQRWVCAACGQTAKARLNTAMYGLKTPSWRVVEVSTALAEGVDITAASRIFGHHERTITRWLEGSGQQARRLE